MKYQLSKDVRKTLAHKQGIGKRFLFVAGVFAIAITAASLNFGLNRASATVPGTNARVNLSGSGSQASQDSNSSTISRDGRFVAFTNNENGFVSGDSNNTYDIFVRDIPNSATTRISVSTSGVSANQGGSVPVISETGRYVVFTSASSNLIDSRTITSSYGQLYMRDRMAGTTTLLTEISAGAYANNDVFPSDVSSDGRYVLFRSYATNLGPTITNGSHNNVFLLDRATSTITWVNAQAPGGSAYGNDTYGAQMSCDGSFIVFDSAASYLGLPYSAHIDVFLLDRRGSDRLTNITAASSGAALNPKISCNGNYIGFDANANNLDTVSTGGYHAYRYDRINDQFNVLDQTSGGTIANHQIVNLFSDPLYLSLSDTGKAAFNSSATNLDAAASSGYTQVFVRDPEAGITELLSRDNGGTEANAGANTPTLSLDGKRAVYKSTATNLVSGDTNSQRDIFVSDTGL